MAETREEAIDRWAQQARDSAVIEMLVDFVRTPEWSVSMLEDIALLVREARPDADFTEFDADDERAWRAH